MYRESHGMDVLGGIHIPIMMGAAFWAGPGSHLKRQGAQNMPTGKAAFGGGIPLVDLDQGAPIPLRFVLQLGHERRPAHITDCFTQVLVFDHVLDG